MIEEIVEYKGEWYQRSKLLFDGGEQANTIHSFKLWPISLILVTGNNGFNLQIELFNSLSFMVGAGF